jgi:hypothetical protein
VACISYNIALYELWTRQPGALLSPYTTFNLGDTSTTVYAFNMHRPSCFSLAAQVGHVCLTDPLPHASVHNTYRRPRATWHKPMLDSWTPTTNLHVSSNNCQAVHHQRECAQPSNGQDCSLAWEDLGSQCTTPISELAVGIDRHHRRACSHHAPVSFSSRLCLVTAHQQFRLWFHPAGEHVLPYTQHARRSCKMPYGPSSVLPLKGFRSPKHSSATPLKE